MSKLLLFDCDETLWTSPNQDYISNHASQLHLVNKRVIEREVDGQLFTLRPGIAEAFAYLKNQGHTLGIVSDNLPEQVCQALKLFGLWPFIDAQAVNVRLWFGYCPKHQMVTEILKKRPFKKLAKQDIWWFDDKDYSQEAQKVGVRFVRATPAFHLADYLMKI